MLCKASVKTKSHIWDDISKWSSTLPAEAQIFRETVFLKKVTKFCYLWPSPLLIYEQCSLSMCHKTKLSDGFRHIWNGKYHPFGHLKPAWLLLKWNWASIVVKSLLKRCLGTDSWKQTGGRAQLCGFVQLCQSLSSDPSPTSPKSHKQLTL